MTDSERGNALWLRQADEWMKREYPAFVRALLLMIDVGAGHNTVR